LHVHPNTVRYRVRRIEKILGHTLGGADDRLVLGLGLRAMRSVAEPRRRSARRSR
jgi:DNA-binding PucR family transcriptional regulator